MGRLLTNQQMNMVVYATDDFRFGTEPTDDSAEILVGLVNDVFVEGGMPIFRAEDVVVMEAVVRGRHNLEMLSRIFCDTLRGRKNLLGLSRGLRSCNSLRPPGYHLGPSGSEEFVVSSRGLCS